MSTKLNKKTQEKNPRYPYYLHPGCNVTESLILSVYYYRAKYDKPVSRRYIERATKLSPAAIVKARNTLVSKGLLDGEKNLIVHPLPKSYVYFDSRLCKSLKFNEILILGAVKIIIAQYNHKKARKTKTAPISDSDISRLTGLSDRTIRHIRPQLISKGYIGHIPYKSGSTWQLLDKGPANRPVLRNPAGHTTTTSRMMDEFKKLYKNPIADKDLPTLMSGLQRLHGVWQKIPKQFTCTTSPGNFGPRAIVRTLFEDLGLPFIAPVTFKQEFFWQKLDTYLVENSLLDAV